MCEYDTQSYFWANTCHLSYTKCQTSARHQTTTLLAFILSAEQAPSLTLAGITIFPEADEGIKIIYIFFFFWWRETFLNTIPPELHLDCGSCIFVVAAGCSTLQSSTSNVVDLQHLPHLLCPLLNSFTDLFCLALFVFLDLRVGCWKRESLSILGPNHFE